MFSHQSPQLRHPPNLHLLRHPKSTTTASSASTNRRSLLLLSTTTLSLPPPLSATQLPPSSPPPPPPPDTTITDRVFLDFSICPNYLRADRTQPQAPYLLPPCPDSEPIGRVILGLYGKLVPITVSNFKSMCTGPSASYKNNLVHKILPGRYLIAGRQGKSAYNGGELRPVSGLARNIEAVDPRAFLLEHNRPGVVSLCLSENDDDEEIKMDPGYRNVEFLITTGPGPCPELDGKNIVFGAVLEGLDVITAIAAVPTFKPAERIRQFNDFAEFIGDERAQVGRAMWDRPLRTVFVSNCGELVVAKPSLSPSLP